MTTEQRNYALDEMRNYTDRDAWLSDIALSSIWGEDGDLPPDRIEALSRLWDVIHLPMRDLLAPLTPTQASRKYYVPLRTVQDWYAGVRSCPVYVRIYLMSR